MVKSIGQNADLISGLDCITRPDTEMLKSSKEEEEYSIESTTSEKLLPSLTLCLTSVICNTLVGPSVVTLTERKPDPGLNLCREMACSMGQPSGIRMKHTGADGPSTTSLPAIKVLHC